MLVALPGAAAANRSRLFLIVCVGFSCCSEWSLRNTGLYLFGTQVILSSCMLVMICSYITMGFVRFSPEGDGHAQFGIFAYPKTAFLPFGSTVRRHAFRLLGGVLMLRCDRCLVD